MDRRNLIGNIALKKYTLVFKQYGITSATGSEGSNQYRCTTDGNCNGFHKITADDGYEFALFAFSNVYKHDGTQLEATYHGSWTGSAFSPTLNLTNYLNVDEIPDNYKYTFVCVVKKTSGDSVEISPAEAAEHIKFWR